MKRKSIIRTCSNCFNFIVFPEIVQKELDEFTYHCSKDMFRTEDDVSKYSKESTFDKPIKCSQWRWQNKELSHIHVPPKRVGFQRKKKVGLKRKRK